MKKYGIENFYVEILESQIKNYNEREKYWISKFNSIYPNGYNILKGGEEPPLLKGEKHWNASLTQEQVNILIDELINSNMTLAKIAKCYNVNYTILRHINKGEAYYQNISYPLRTQRKRSVEAVEQALLKGGR